MPEPLDAPNEDQDAKVAAAALDALRAADFPYTERVDRLAEILALLLLVRTTPNVAEPLTASARHEHSTER